MLAIDPAVVESALRELFAAERPANLLDIGTGTGRILQVLAGEVGFGLGIDLSHDMLAVARANLDQREARNCQVRHGDMYQLPLPDASFAAATLHQVLHYADDPLAALAEAARVLVPGGWLVVVDLAAHGMENLREQSGHRRLGFSDEELGRWFEELGLLEREQRRLTGPELTVVIWTARRPPMDIDTTTPIPRRSAA
jgi:ArsR family transcriptional regulator